MNELKKIILILAVILLTSCKAECPPERIAYVEDITSFPTTLEGDKLTSQILVIGGRDIEFDRIISGPVCNDNWQGTIYLTCDIQIPIWEDNPFFFQDCNLVIEDNAVIYVEAHNNKMYDKGCSCHE